MFQRSTVAAAAVAVLLPTPAFAVSNSSATMGPLQVTLFDLNPTDNIEASITFTGQGDFVQTQAYDSFTVQEESREVFGVGLFDPISTFSATSTSSAAASVSGTGTAQGTTLSASGTALGTATPGGVNSPQQYSSFSATATFSHYYSNQSFTLSSGTAVVMTAASVLSASVTNTFDPHFTNGWENASAGTSISLSGVGPDGSGWQNSSDSLSINAGSTYVADPNCFNGYCNSGASASDSGSMGVSFINVSGGDLTGQFNMSASANGSSHAPVPEPGTYAMLLAGLAAVGSLARRRRA